MLAEAPRTNGVRRFLQALLALFALSSGAALAREPAASEPARDPWRVAVPVADQGSDSRRDAEREALATVLVRVTGRESVLGLPALRAALRSPQQYYTASGYQRREARERLADPDARPWLFVIEFDAASVTDLLAREAVPVWTTRRPEFLVWILAEDEQGARRLVGADDPIGTALLRRAERRGLEVFLPAVDLTDIASFPMGEAWAGFGDVIARASRRYGPEYFVTLRLFPDPLGRWVADWQGEIAGAEVSGALEVADALSGAEAMLDVVADDLADRFAIRVDAGSGARALWLQVDRIDALEAYAGLMRYLEDTDGVVDVQLVQMQGSSLLLRVDVADATDRLLDLLRLEARLLPASEPDPVGGVPVWRARWVGSSR